MVDEEFGPPLFASGLGPRGCSVDPQTAPLLDEPGNVLARPQAAEAEELLAIELQPPTLPRLQRSRPRAVPLDLSFDEMLLLRNGKVGMDGGSPSMSDDVSDDARLRRS